MIRIVIAIWGLILLVGCSKERDDSVFQVSIIDALLAGNYQGYYKCEELLEHGDFGLGTFNELDGEMLILDGEIYQVKGDGSIDRPSKKTMTPFGVIKYFSSDSMLQVEGVGLEEFENFLDQCFPDQSKFYAIQVNGYFSRIKTRSLFAQKPPYKPLIDIPMNKFTTSETEGTLIGFRCPVFVKGLNVPGYHFHFLSKDHLFGGHVLDFYLKKGTIRIDESREFKLLLPDDEGELSAMDNSKDRTEELNKVER